MQHGDGDAHRDGDGDATPTATATATATPTATGSPTLTPTPTPVPSVTPTTAWSNPVGASAPPPGPGASATPTRSPTPVGPTVGATVLPEPNTAGWRLSEVQRHLGGDRAGRNRLQRRLGPYTQTSDTAGTTVTCSVTDALGRTVVGTAVVRQEPEIRRRRPTPSAPHRRRAGSATGAGLASRPCVPPTPTVDFNTPTAVPPGTPVPPTPTPAPTYQPRVLITLQSTDAASGVQSLDYSATGASSVPPSSAPGPVAVATVVLFPGTWNGEGSCQKKEHPSSPTAPPTSPDTPSRRKRSRSAWTL